MHKYCCISHVKLLATTSHQISTKQRWNDEKKYAGSPFGKPFGGGGGHDSAVCFYSRTNSERRTWPNFISTTPTTILFINLRFWRFSVRDSPRIIRISVRMYPSSRESVNVFFVWFSALRFYKSVLNLFRYVSTFFIVLSFPWRRRILFIGTILYL